jgi:tetratricopeptide (TPR) repeat protein
MAMRAGRYEEAVESLRGAVAAEDSLHYDEPPAWYYPTRQALGSALLKAGKPADAETAFREDLKRYPNNGWSLYGLANALSARGRVTEAVAMKKRFTRAWIHADFKLGTP